VPAHDEGIISVVPPTVITAVHNVSIENPAGPETARNPPTGTPFKGDMENLTIFTSFAAKFVGVESVSSSAHTRSPRLGNDPNSLYVIVQKFAPGVVDGLVTLRPTKYRDVTGNGEVNVRVAMRPSPRHDATGTGLVVYPGGYTTPDPSTSVTIYWQYLSKMNPAGARIVNTGEPVTEEAVAGVNISKINELSLFGRSFRAVVQ
jgi:hypothetical protein